VNVDLVFPKFKLLSGAERLILSLGRALAARGQRVRVLCHHFDPSCRPLLGDLTLVETGVRLDRTGNHYLDSVLSYLLSSRLRRAVAPDTDVVCLFGPALPLAWRRGAKAVRLLYFCYEPPRATALDIADVLARVGRWRWLLAPALQAYRHLDRWLVGRVDAVLVNGEFGRERVRAAYGRDARVITHGVDLRDDGTTRAAARAAVGIPPCVPAALTVNFLHPRKRIDLLLAAWARVEKRLPEATLLVVGDGPEAGALREVAARLGTRGVRFCGFVAEDRLPLYYRAADLLVHVARQETFGLTVLEAAAFGLPVVAADEGGPRYTVADGETGLLVAPEEDEIAGALVALLAEPSRAQHMGDRGRQRMRSRFTWERGAQDFLDACAALGTA
jgi:glycosyltransferase involved in cell wall biosynthesis